MIESRPYADPYIAGAALGLVLLAAFVVMGRGLGASGAFTSTAASLVSAVSPASAAASPVLARHSQSDGVDWLVFEILGVIIGGFLSAFAAGRLRFDVERGPRISNAGRLLCAGGGGLTMGAGAVLARGCTSGLALTGGALLSVGSWLFIITAFAAGYLVAPLMKRAWQ